MAKCKNVLVEYDYEKLRENFANMSDDDVMKEYMDISNRILDLMDLYSHNQITWDRCMVFVENLEYAKDYISRYCALNYLSDHGYKIDDNLRIFPPINDIK